MSHSLSKIWIHLVIGTKDNYSYIKEPIEQKIYSHMTEILWNQFSSYVKIINGMPNHIHILLLLNCRYSLSEIIKNVKGNTSHWINEQNLCHNFRWRPGYGAFSVSEILLDKIYNYIKIQKEHHKEETFIDEYKKLLKKYGLKEE